MHREIDNQNALTLEAEVREERHVLGALLRLSQLGEDQETPPALAATPSNTLHTDSEVVEVALGNIASLPDPQAADVLQDQVDERGNDADGEDPFGDVERDDL